ncbi:unnamed protein product (macronuclear) [Paramecium tetraurelia]|uniref:Uncharacterized protein n=1 Tax=Paramecium tetraurelia TaxID=5888 RepID=A0DJX4_PARTE|nr:uncharacterized protein GSPATT00017685001 [Paramecium tetraurelia]CAK83341.1 unnamed protein product [Paramecium tetraurelia]|eukprot:XP_001450738.1 hypothetical protein (macronuclear) [Paramecium tetraurelia strain d4-2]
MFIQQPPSRQPYLQPKLPFQQQFHQNNFIQQHFAPQIKQQFVGQNQYKPDLMSSIPFAKSIQYEVPRQNEQAHNNNQDQKKHSSEMVQLIKESQELKKNINEKDQEIQKCKQNIDRLEQLIDYLEKQQKEAQKEQ